MSDFPTRENPSAGMAGQAGSPPPGVPPGDAPVPSAEVRGAGFGAGGSGTGGPGAGGGASLRSERGVTKIADVVVAKIAAIATREIPGVQDMGRGLSRAFGAMRSRIPGGTTQASTQGVAVEVGERQAAVDIDIVVYYGQSIVEVTEAVRANVIGRLEGMTGLEVVEVNIAVDDLYIEGEGNLAEQPPGPQGPPPPARVQ